MLKRQFQQRLRLLPRRLQLQQVERLLPDVPAAR